MHPTAMAERTAVTRRKERCNDAPAPALSSAIVPLGRDGLEERRSGCRSTLPGHFGDPGFSNAGGPGLPEDDRRLRGGVPASRPAARIAAAQSGLRATMSARNGPTAFSSASSSRSIPSVSAKTSGRAVPLAPSAVRLLATLPRDEDNPWVIAGKLPGSYLTHLQHPWRRIRARAELPDVRIHDLRHSCATSPYLLAA